MFGQAVRVSYDDSEAGARLRSELSLYPTLPAGQDHDLEIVLGEIPVPSRALVNPAIHSELEDGFLADFGSVMVRWQFDAEWALRRVFFQLRTPLSSALRRRAQRMRSIQFATTEESIGQIFHELVLVPTVYFAPGRFLLHASALQAPDGGVTLVGGTGGVGKTSLELELCRHHDYQFVADDIVAADETGHAWPNLAFPKIYGYNLTGDPELSRVVLGGRGLEDRLHWRLHSSRGPNRVRRRISPVDLYGRHSTAGGQIKRYVFIAREIRDDLVSRPAALDEMAALSMSVMKAEYEAFHRHLEWHGMNRLLKGEAPIFSTSSIFDRWRAAAARALEGIECSIVRAPKHIEHSEFRERMAALVAGA